MKKSAPNTFCAFALLYILAHGAFASTAGDSPDATSRGFLITDGTNLASIVTDPADYPVVMLAANLFANDVQRVTGRRPHVLTKKPPVTPK